MFIPDVESEERVALRQTVRHLVEMHSPESVVRDMVDSDDGFDRSLWSRMANEIGLQGVGILEELGGAGGGPAEIAIIQFELGRALVPSPYFSSCVLAAQLLNEIRDDSSSSLLKDLAEGERIATVAPLGSDGGWRIGDAQVIAHSEGLEWSITGECHFVTDAVAADVVLVPTRTDEGISVFAVDMDAPGVTRVALETLDLTRRMATVTFTRAPARLIGREGQSGDALARMLDTAALGLAAEQVGGADRVVTMAIDYARERVQFGRTIASFQVIKHKLTDLVVELERMKSALAHLINLAERGAAETSLVAHLTQAFCSETYFGIAVENIQIHGGIGFTWEHPAHLFFRRAKSTEMLLGDASFHREAMLSLLGA